MENLINELINRGATETAARELAEMAYREYETLLTVFTVRRPEAVDEA